MSDAILGKAFKGELQVEASGRPEGECSRKKFHRMP